MSTALDFSFGFVDMLDSIEAIYRYFVYYNFITNIQQCVYRYFCAYLAFAINRDLNKYVFMY